MGILSETNQATSFELPLPADANTYLRLARISRIGTPVVQKCGTSIIWVGARPSNKDDQLPTISTMLNNDTHEIDPYGHWSAGTISAKTFEDSLVEEPNEQGIYLLPPPEITILNSVFYHCRSPLAAFTEIRRLIPPKEYIAFGQKLPA